MNVLQNCCLIESPGGNGYYRPSVSTTTMRKRRERYMESIIKKDLENVEKKLQNHQRTIHTPPR